MWVWGRYYGRNCARAHTADRRCDSIGMGTTDKGKKCLKKRRRERLVTGGDATGVRIPRDFCRRRRRCKHACGSSS